MIPQNNHSVPDQTARRIKYDLGRKWSAIIQVFCGIVVLVCGIILLGVNIPQNNKDRSPYQRWKALSNPSVGIWTGVIFMGTAAFGLFKRTNKIMISLYLAASSVSFFVAIGVVGVAGGGIGVTKHILEYSDCDYNYQPYNSPEACCFDRYRYRCPNDNYDAFTVAPVYSSVQCHAVREHADMLQEICNKETTRAGRTNLAFYIFMLTAGIIEVFTSLAGSVVVIVTLCHAGKCCGQSQPQVIYLPYPVPMNQLSGGEGMIVMPPHPNIPPPIPTVPTGIGYAQEAPPSYFAVADNQDTKFPYRGV